MNIPLTIRTTQTTLHTAGTMVAIGIALVFSFVLFSPVTHAATASVTIAETSVQQGVQYFVDWTSSGAQSCEVTGPGFYFTGLTGHQPVTQTTTGLKSYAIACQNTSGSCTWTLSNSYNEDVGCQLNNECTPASPCSPQGASCTNERPVGSGGFLCATSNYTCSGSCSTSTVTGTDSVTITAASAPTATLTGPTSIAYGSSGTLTWSSTGASTCAGTGFSTGGATSNGTGVTITPVANTTYSISCINGFGGTGTATKTVTVTDVPAAIATLSASPTSVTLGGSSTLTWSSSNATTCTGTGFSTGGNTAGSVSVTPATNTLYSVTCTGQGGANTKSAAVSVGSSGGGTGVITYQGGPPYGTLLPDVSSDIPSINSSNISVYGIYHTYGDSVVMNTSVGTIRACRNPSPQGERACDLIDPAGYQYVDVFNAPTACRAAFYSSPADNGVLKWNGSSWFTANAGSSNEFYNYLTCKSNEKPDTALSGNGVAADASITVAAGTAVNLTWLSQYGAVRKGVCSAQNFATDTWVPGHWEDNWICESGCGGNSGQVCASAPLKPLAAVSAEILHFFGLKPDVAYAARVDASCTNDPVWVPGATSNQPFGGSTTVYPAVTTTYTYTCANANGSSAKSLTVNVPTGPQCSDGLDNDSDGTCDIGGCTVSSVVLPADPGCMDGTDTTEDPNPPPAPVLSSAVCSSDGTSVTLDWSDTSPDGYYLRISKPASTSCPSGWVVAGWDSNTCIPNPDLVSPSNYANYPVSVGVAYSYAVHSRTATGEWGTPANGSFTCNPATAPITASCSVSPSTIATGQNVTWTALAGGGTPPYVYTWTGTTPLSGVGNPKVVQYATTGVKTGSVTITDSLAASSGAVACTTGGGGDPGGNPTVTITPAAPTANLMGPASVITGANATLTWSSTDATSCVGTGFNTGGAAINLSPGVTVGPLTNPPQAFYDYQVTCTGATAPPASGTHRVNISTPTAYITAVPDRVKAGDSAVVSWSADQVGSCTVTGTDGYSSGAITGPTIATSTSNVSRIITKQTTFTIICDGASPSDTVIVNVTPQFEEF